MTHYAPDRCVITLGCEGRLTPSGYTSDGSSLLGVPPTGLLNWHQRGSTSITAKSLQSDVLLDTSTGSKRQLIIAVRESVYLPLNPQTLTVPLIAEQQNPRDFRQYTFRKEGAFDSINGVESGVSKKVLRYSLAGATPDVVEVFVNGIKRQAGGGLNDYQLHNSSLATNVPPNTVLFNSAILDATTQVDVIVTKAALQSTFTLSLNRMIDDDSRIGIGAWEGVNKVSSSFFAGETLALFYVDLDQAPNIPVDVRFTVDLSSAILAGVSTIQPEDAIVLLTVSGLTTSIDTIQSKCIRLSSLRQGGGYLVSKFVEGTKRMYITGSSLSPVFPAFKKILFNAPVLQKKNLSGNNDAISIDSDFSVGPDK